MVKKRQNDPQKDNSTDESFDEKQSNSPGSNSMGTCIHIKNSIDTAKVIKTLKKDGLKLNENCSLCMKMQSNNKSPDELFEYDKTLWLCLKCGTQLCGRSDNKHALEHYERPRSDEHALAMNTTTFDIWCYSCDKEIDRLHPKVAPCVEQIKKFSEKSLKSSAEKDDANSIEEIRQVMTDLTPLAAATGTSTATMTNNVSNMNAERSAIVDSLPSVRGLTNLGNTCFFNAVLQCLAQTPFLLEVLKEAFESGEEFVLPGGKLKIKDEEIELPPIKGKLEGLGGLSTALVETLEQLQKGGFVYTPTRLLNKFRNKCPQFEGYDQHDSHECLRQLLESVRCEDLNRYKRVILQDLGLENQKAETASDEVKQKCKFYGGQAADRILRPEPVFRGFLVSTLRCQDCFHTSSCHESFLDLSLPVSVEKPQPPIRCRSSPETSPTQSGIAKHQTFLEKKRERKNEKKKQQRALSIVDTIGPHGDILHESIVKKEDDNISNDSPSSSSSSSEQSDADIEDNVVESERKRDSGRPVNRNIPQLFPQSYDPNGNSELPSPMNLEKRGDSPENPNKDSNDDENDSGIATSPANTTMMKHGVKGGFIHHNRNNGDEDSMAIMTANNVVVELGISDQGATLIMQRSLSQSSNGAAGDVSSVSNFVPLTTELELLNLNASNSEITAAKRKARKKRVRTQSYSDWCTTIAPRYQCEEGECSIQSCLNNFTALELMTGNNKVGCDECTKRINRDNGKKIYTNATKQFLISSPPAVLILHLKRFQVGPRCMFRKLTRAVSFPMVLDIAPFCGSKIKNLPNVNRKQKKLLYALYGVVEHSGGMYGGHYTAFVKVRPKLTANDPRWKFLPKGNKAELDQTDEQLAKLQEIQEKAGARERARQLRISENDSDDSTSSSSSTSILNLSTNNYHRPDETEGAVGGLDESVEEKIPPQPPGKWFYVSDSKVMSADEEAVLKAQAYLLFYERIY